MRIHTEVVIDMETMEVIKDDFYEYEGPVALCGGGSSAPVYSTSNEEKQLLTTQNALLQKQIDLTNQTTPILISSYGYKYDDDGNLVEKTQQEKIDDMSPAEYAAYEEEMLGYGLDAYGNKLSDSDLYDKLSTSEKLQYDITQKSNERYLQALNGELPLSQSLQKELDTEKSLATENLKRKLGPNWELSSAGIKTMNDLETKEDLIKDEASRGEISAADVRFQNSVTNEMRKSSQTKSNWLDSIQQKLGVTSGLSNTSNSYNSAMAGAASLAGQYRSGSQAEYNSAFNAWKTNQESSNSMWGAVGSLTGAGLSAASGYFGSAAIAAALAARR